MAPVAFPRAGRAERSRPSFFFALALWALHDVLGRYRYRDIAAALGAIPAASLAAALALTVAGYTVVIGYDVLAVRFALRHIALGSS